MHTRHSTFSWRSTAILLFAFLAGATADAVKEYTTTHHGRQNGGVGVGGVGRQNLRQFEAFPEATSSSRTTKAAAAAVDVDDEGGPNEHSRHRTKRMIWITDDGRLALPPGTVLSISPTISLPLVRYPPSGFLSNMTMSFPLTSKFDALV